MSYIASNTRNILDAVGHTPLVNLSNLVKHLDLPKGSRILAKLEYLNPGFSKYVQVDILLIIGSFC